MSNQTQANSNRPSFEAFYVKDNGEGKGIWIKVGALWAHRDGKGFNLNLEMLPAPRDGKYTLVIREVLEPTPTDQD